MKKPQANILKSILSNTPKKLILNAVAASVLALNLSCTSSAVPDLIRPTASSENKSQDLSGLPSQSTLRVPSNPTNLIALGDIYDPAFPQNASRMRQMLQYESGMIALLGDIQYPNGSIENFINGFDKEFSMMKDRFIPIPGNHEYEDPGAKGYFEYFNVPPYYNVDLPSVNIFALNTNIPIERGSRQYTWVKSSLKTNTKSCVALLTHYPFAPSFTSGPNQEGGNLRDIIDLAINYRVTLILSSHNHHYEEFGQMLSNGMASPLGIKPFVVGTGGHNQLYNFANIQPGSVERVREYGFLHMTFDGIDVKYSFKGFNSSTSQKTLECNARTVFSTLP